jgi:hypothetical protein
MSQRFTIWQCRDWCCSSRPHSDRWWNVGIAPGNYESVHGWRAAMSIARSGKLAWST